MITDNRIAIRCTLAKHHTGDHCEVSSVPARKPCGAVIRYEERVAEEACPPVAPVEVATNGATYSPDPDAEHDTAIADEAERHDGALPPPTPPAPVPAEPPSLAYLIESAEVADDWVTNARIEKERADAELDKAIASQERRRSAVAQRAGEGALVMVGSVLFRSVPPRKPKGGEGAEGALWRLEPVEVKK